MNRAARGRVVACMRKSVREAKRHTSWTEADAVLEAELEDFVRRLLDLDASPAFLADLHGFVERIAPAGAVNGVVQQALAATLLGVPDIYRGSEREDVSLVDPDNRRPVDFAALAAGFDPDARPAGLLSYRRDVRIRQWLLARLLSVRRRHRSAFAGGHRGLRTVGPAARHLVAFERAGAGARLVVAVLRHPFAADVGAADLAPDPARLAGARLRLSGIAGLHDLLTDRRIASGDGGVPAAELFAVLPVVVGVPLAGHGRRPRRAVGPTAGRLTAAPR
jgi:maltooligosyltrehalose synthase